MDYIYRCAGCGELPDEKDLDGSGGHCVTGMSANGPYPQQCGPVYRYENVTENADLRAQLETERMFRSNALDEVLSLRAQLTEAQAKLEQKTLEYNDRKAAWEDICLRHNSVRGKLERAREDLRIANEKLRQWRHGYNSMTARILEAEVLELRGRTFISGGE